MSNKRYTEEFKVEAVKQITERFRVRIWTKAAEEKFRYSATANECSGSCDYGCAVGTKMLNHKYTLVTGLISDLKVHRGEENFFADQAAQTIGGTAAAGLAIEGLAGAASGAIISGGNMAESVEVFVCKVGSTAILGRFGAVTFADGDWVEVVGKPREWGLDAFAIRRPSDRTIWMHPHCSRGHRGYRRYWIRASLIAASTVVSLFVLGVLTFSIFQEENPFPWWFWVVSWMVAFLLFFLVLSFTATRFTRYSYISTEIFTALGFENPDEVDLPARHRIASKNASHAERAKFHPFARWVYRY